MNVTSPWIRKFTNCLAWSNLILLIIIITSQSNVPQTKWWHMMRISKTITYPFVFCLFLINTKSCFGRYSSLSTYLYRSGNNKQSTHAYATNTFDILMGKSCTCADSCIFNAYPVSAQAEVSIKQSINGWKCMNSGSISVNDFPC